MEKKNGIRCLARSSNNLSINCAMKKRESGPAKKSKTGKFYFFWICLVPACMTDSGSIISQFIGSRKILCCDNVMSIDEAKIVMK